MTSTWARSPRWRLRRFRLKPSRRVYRPRWIRRRGERKGLKWKGWAPASSAQSPTLGLTVKELWRCLLRRLPPPDGCRAFRAWGFTSTFHTRIQAPLPRIGPAALGAWNLMRLATIRCHPSPPPLRSAFCRCMRLWPREKLRRCKCGSMCMRRFHRRKANPLPPRSGLRGQSATSSDQGARRGSHRAIRSGTLPTLGQGRTKRRRIAKIQSGRAYKTNTGSPASSHDFPRFPRGIAIDRAQVSTA
mmetsp:Transcript_10188/g.39790  ORF Transcript_10188/g.39790 Transcript_10188/m.39790 type:complete len:245 (+) Transcript_10188:173-907(+)